MAAEEKMKKPHHVNSRSRGDCEHVISVGAVS